MGQTTDFIEFTDSQTAVAPAGRLRFRLHGGVAQQSVDGGAWSTIGGGGGGGSVNSVAATAAGLLAVAGTATDPTVGLAVAAANTMLGNFTGGSAVPTAGTTATVQAALGIDTGTLITVTGSAVQAVDMTPMSGDLDGDYDIDINILLPTGSTPKITIAPNNLTTNLTGVSFLGGTGNTTDGTHIVVATVGTTYTSLHIFGRFSSKTGRPRFFTGLAFGTTAAGVIAAFVVGGTWTDTATAITKITINSDIAATIGVGSTFRWQKRNFLA